MVTFSVMPYKASPSGPPPAVYDGTANDIAAIPSRAELVRRGDGAARVAADEAAIAARRPLHFMPNDVFETNEWTNGTPTYKIHLFGCLPSGAKAHVILDGVEVYFDARVPAGVAPRTFARGLRVALGDEKLTPTLVRVHRAFPIRGFRKEPVDWVRLVFSNLQERKKAVNHVRDSLGYETASDDRSAYYRMAARNYQWVLTDWGRIRGYRHYRGGGHPDGPSEDAGRVESPLCEHVFRVDAASFAPLVPPAGTRAEQDAGEAEKKAHGLRRDRTVVFTWDIETYDSAETGDLPVAARATSVMFCIGITVHFKDDPQPLASVFLTAPASEGDADWTTIVCGTETNVIRALAIALHRLAPDFVVGFNDGGYDWPFVLARAADAGVLGWLADTASAVARRRPTSDDAALKWNVQTDKAIKVAADQTAFVTFLKVPGFICFDVRSIFRQMFSKADVAKKSSLNFYLERCKLPSKADLPYKEMWAIYKARDTANMRKVAHYNVIDSIRCQQLLVRRSVIDERRAVSALAYTSMFDALYYAGGMKVRNLLISRANAKGYLCTNISTDQRRGGKYPGAWVFPPEKGLCPDPSEPSLRELEAARAGYITSVKNAVLGMFGDSFAKMSPELAAALRPPAKSSEAAAEAGGEAETKTEGPAPGNHTIETAMANHTLVKAFVEGKYGELADAPESVRAEIAAAEARIAAALENFEPSRPVTGLDFSSLYPSIIMTYNLSPEKFVETAEEAAELKKEGYDLHRTEFDFEGKPVEGWFVRHGGDTAQFGIYPEILIELFNRRKAMKKRLHVFEEQVEHMELVYGEAEKAAGSGRGFGEVVAAELAAARAALAAADPRSEEHHKASLDLEYLAPLVERTGPFAAGPADLRARFDDYYEEAKFQYNKIDLKQKALKVFMNTFYGEAGNQLSAFFLLQLAGGVTVAGQYNIKKVDAFARSKGFRVKYGDTDSVYVCAPDSVFAESDRAYARALIDKETYWSRLVVTTMRHLRVLRDEVNADLTADNGTKFLKVAYEEVLWPYGLLGKKKYFGIPHVAQPNFRPKDLFLRGIDIVKQGQTKYTKKIGIAILWQCVSLANDRGMVAIVEAVLKDAVENTEQWNFDDFIKSAAWKPLKQNHSVQRFIARMRVKVAEELAMNERRVAAGRERLPALYTIPDPGERFRYVLARLPSAYGLRGLKSTGKVGDVMEFAAVAAAKNIPVDIARYLKSYVVGLCARFVLFDPRFEQSGPLAARMTPKEVDEATQKAAKKYLERYIRALQGDDPVVARKRGAAYRKAWKRAAVDCAGRVRRQLGNSAELFQGEHLDWELFLEPSAGEVVNALALQAGKVVAGADCSALVRAHCLSRGVDPKTGGDTWVAGGDRVVDPKAGGNLYRAAEEVGAKPPPRRRGRRRRLRQRDLVLRNYNALEASTRAELEIHVDILRDVAVRYEVSLSAVVDAYRTAEHQANANLGTYRAGGKAPAEPLEGDDLVAAVAAVEAIRLATAASGEASAFLTAAGEAPPPAFAGVADQSRGLVALAERRGVAVEAVVAGAAPTLAVPWVFGLSGAESAAAAAVRAAWYRLQAIYFERNLYAALDAKFEALKSRRVRPRGVAPMTLREAADAARGATIPEGAPRAAAIGAM